MFPSKNSSPFRHLYGGKPRARYFAGGLAGAAAALLVCAWMLASCGTPRRAVSEAFSSPKLAELGSVVTQGIAEKRLPGAVIWLERGGVVYERAYGWRETTPESEEMTTDTIFDLASLTKVVATTPSVMILVEQGKVDLEAPLSRYLTEFTGKGREKITIRQLLTHTSGLRPSMSRPDLPAGYTAVIEQALLEAPVNPPGSMIVYSDINFMFLAELVRRVSGEPLDQFAARNIFHPLKMVDTEFRPSVLKAGRIAPTEIADGILLRGVVHDPVTRRMGGISGQAGLFSTDRDLARYCRMLLNGGELDGARILQPATVRLMTSVQTPPALEGRRGLGWDIDTGYSRRGNLFPLGSYGHTGWTGGMIWVDPFSKTFVVFLSNRVHPDGKGDIRKLQRTISTVAAEAVIGFDFAHVTGALAPVVKKEEAVRGEVLNGIDVLKTNEFRPLRGLKVGLITNHTGRDRKGEATIELLQHAPGVELKVLFSPEHGIRGDLDASVGDSVDARSGLPVYSLYGRRRAPAPEQLAGLDALVFDIQDIGCRFYTYIATLGNCLEAAGKAHIRFIVLDRVNPISGAAIEGPLNEGAPIFTAFHSMPVRHGMTIGELARMINEERGFQAALEVIPVAGWKRGEWFDETGLSWINPSPNMRSLTEATFYPGIGLLETTSLSVGRGTDAPFEKVGAPYVAEADLAKELEALHLPGVRFEPIRFTPTASTHKGESCGGVRIILTDRARCRPVAMGMAMAHVMSTLYPKQFDLAKFNTHLRNKPTIEALARGDSLEAIERSWDEGLRAFEARRAKVLLY